MERSEQISEFAAAFAVAQGKIAGAMKDKTNPHFKSSYADLSSVMEACKKPLNDEGIAILQFPVPDDGDCVSLETILMHKSGQWVSSKTRIPLQRKDPQSFGSAMTYARRYGLSAMTGVCPEDDDGEGAMNRQPQRPTTPANKPAPVKQPAKPAIQDNDLANDVFGGLLDKTRALLVGRGFDDDGIAAALAKAEDSKKRPLPEFTPEDWNGLNAAISKGQFDKFKKTNGAPVGAGK